MTINSRTPIADYVDEIERMRSRAFQNGLSVGTFIGWLLGAFTVGIWWAAA